MLDAHAVLQVLQRMGCPPAPASLDDLAADAGWSPYHLHRAFRRVVGETPLQYQRRLRLEAAALALRTTDHSIGDVAHGAGFASHPGFTRAFTAHFGHTPADHRARSAEPDALVGQLGPCIGLFHLATARTRPMSISVQTQTRDPQPILYMRRRVAPSEVQATLAECLPAVFLHCQKQGIAMAGPPFTRYPELGRHLITLECGIPVAGPAAPTDTIQAGELAGGTLAVAIHEGGYDTLSETHAAVERWLESHGHTVAGGPWEVYLTDPAEHPDPKDWKTEICWPYTTG